MTLWTEGNPTNEWTTSGLNSPTLSRKVREGCTNVLSSEGTGPRETGVRVRDIIVVEGVFRLITTPFDGSGSVFVICFISLGLEEVKD